MNMLLTVRKAGTLDEITTGCHRPPNNKITTVNKSLKYIQILILICSIICSAVLSQQAHGKEREGKARLQVYSLRRFPRQGPTVEGQSGLTSVSNISKVYIKPTSSVTRILKQESWSCSSLQQKPGKITRL